MADFFGPKAKDLVGHQIESCDNMNERLCLVLHAINSVIVPNPATNQTLTLGFTKKMDNLTLEWPQKDDVTRATLRPSDCREHKRSYTGRLFVDLVMSCDGVCSKVQLDLGEIPIMVMSKYCNLRDYNRQLLRAYREDPSEVGGYFILDGIKTVIPPLILPKRNYPMTIQNSFHSQDEGYTDKAIAIRCVRDSYFVTVKLYYMENKSVTLEVWIKGKEFLLPVGLILKALMDTPDIATRLKSCCLGKKDKQEERAKLILKEVEDLHLSTRHQCIEYIGERVKSAIGDLENEPYQVGNTFLRGYILVHLLHGYEKFNLLMFMLQKLYSLVDQTSDLDDPDSLQNQEVLLPGDLISNYLKVKIEDWLQKAKVFLQKEVERGISKNQFRCVDILRKVLEVHPSTQICSWIEDKLKTAGLSLQQGDSFLSSPIRAIHQRASFDELHTSVQESLLKPQGFLHTLPTCDDGEPLCLHMTSTCSITSLYDAQGKTYSQDPVKDALVKIGMTLRLDNASPPAVTVLSVLLNGAVVGSISRDEVEKFVDHLRRLKVTDDNELLPHHLEVGYVPLRNHVAAYPGVYLFTTPSRFVRPVKNISLDQVELIGPFEQVFMKIRNSDDQDGGGEAAATHEEIHRIMYPRQESDSMEEENSKEEENETMESKVVEHVTLSDPSQSTFSLTNDDHTLANAVRFTLNQDPRTTYCGYSIPHPDNNKVNIRIQTTGDPARDVLVDACQNLKEVCQHVKRTFDKALDDYKMRNQLDDMDIG